jgi:hypothetical protein
MEKGQVVSDLAFCKAVPRTGKPRYFEYPCVELDVLVDICDSFFCAHAPKLRALAKTVTIMIAFNSFNVYRLLSLPVAPFF